MNTAAQAAVAVPVRPRPAAPSAVAADDASERGRTVVTHQAVERIAARLVADCPDVGGTARRVLGLGGGDAVVAVRLHGARAVSLAVRCSVPYPRPVRRSAEALRELLMTRVPELTGMRVQRVDVTVTWLPTPAASGRRVE